MRQQNFYGKVVKPVPSADGSVIIDVDMNTSKADKDLSKLKSNIEKTEQQLAETSKQRDEAQQKSLFDAGALDDEKAKLQEIKDRLADIRAMSKDKTLSPEIREKAKNLIPSVKQELQDQRDRVRGLQTEWNKTESSIERYNRQIATAEAKLEQQKSEAGALQQSINAAEQARADIAKNAEVADQRIVDLNKELLQLKRRQAELEQAGVGQGYKEYDVNAARISAAKQELKEYQKVLSGAGKGQEQPINRTTAAAQKLNSILPKIKNGFKTIGRAAVDGFKAAGKAIGSAVSRLNIFSRISDGLRPKMKRIGGLIKRAFVFTVIYKGLRLLKQQVSSYLMINSEFSNALSQLKGVLLTAFQPIYSAIIPALVTLMNVLSRVIAVIAQFTAFLFGSTAKKAQANAKALNSQAKAFGAAGGAADDAAKSLANFDEINKLEDNKGGGGGGGGGGMDTGPLFDYEYEDMPFDSWGEAFSALLDKMLAGIPKLESAFQKFAEGLNGLNQKIYDMFKFPGVLEKVQQLGHDLAEAFNHLVDNINWLLMGQALGAGLNLALQFLVNLIYTFDWVGLGMALAAAINGLVSEIDWYAFGQLLWSGFKIGLEMLAGFILGLNMPELAKAASNLVMGFFNSITETIQRVPWNEIGQKIADFINGIDWVGALSSIAGSIAAGLNAVVTALGTLVRGLDWKSVGRALGESVNKLFSDINWADLGKTLSDGIGGAIQALITFVRTTDWHAVGESIITALKNIDWFQLLMGLGELIGELLVAALEMIFADPKGLIEIGKEIIAGLNLGIVQAMLNILAWLKENVVDPIVNAIKQLFGIHSPSTVMIEIGENLIAGLLQGISDTWHTIVEFFDKKIAAIKKTLSDAWAAIKSTASEKWAAIKETIGAVWENLKTTATATFENIKTAISTAWENIKTDTSEKWESIKTFMSETWDKIKTAADTVFTSIKDGISAAWDAVSAKTGEIWESIKESVSQLWNDLKESASTAFNAIKDVISDIWESIKRTTEDVWNGILSAIKGVINGIIGAVESMANGIVRGLNTMINALNKLHFDIPSWIPGIGGKSFGLKIPQLSGVSIPRLAEGAVIPPNREFMAVLGDQRSGTNIETPLATMVQAFKQAMSESGMNGGRDITVVMELDKREFARAVYTANNDETQRVGLRLAGVRA